MAAATNLMDSPWDRAGTKDELKSGSVLHLGTGGVWGEVRVVLRHTMLEVLRLQRQPNTAGIAGPIDPSLEALRGPRSDQSRRAPRLTYDRLARVPLHMCIVEAVSHPDGAFAVTAATGDGARVVLRPRFGDAHARALWLSAVRAARDALPPPEMRTPGPPDRFSGALQYLGWVRLAKGSAEVSGAPAGARMVMAVSDHDVRLIRSVPLQSKDLDDRCVVRMPLASCRVSISRSAPAVGVDPQQREFELLCVNGAKFSFTTGQGITAWSGGGVGGTQRV